MYVCSQVVHVHCTHTCTCTNVYVHVYEALILYTCTMYMYMYMSSKRVPHAVRYSAYIIWLMLPSNQSFYRLIVGFGMDVADCEVGQ